MLTRRQFDDWALEQKPRRNRARLPDPSAERLVRIRHRTGLSQVRFARLLNVSVRTLGNWEQGRPKPTGPAASLPRIVEREPALALRALRIALPPRRGVQDLYSPLFKKVRQ